MMMMTTSLPQLMIEFGAWGKRVATECMLYDEIHQELLHYVFLSHSSATNRWITSKDHASFQINVGHLDENGIYTGQFSTFALCGYVRALVLLLTLISVLVHDMPVYASLYQLIQALAICQFNNSTSDLLLSFFREMPTVVWTDSGRRRKLKLNDTRKRKLFF
ncbi:hypothetical protein GBA52_021045 [Prunus armeniaca]|nr:hypothetical protein GBA52_021045 [Prunus armeniaca]